MEIYHPTLNAIVCENCNLGCASNSSIFRIVLHPKMWSGLVLLSSSGCNAPFYLVKVDGEGYPLCALTREALAQGVNLTTLDADFPEEQMAHLINASEHLLEFKKGHAYLIDQAWRMRDAR